MFSQFCFVYSGCWVIDNPGYAVCSKFAMDSLLPPTEEMSAIGVDGILPSGLTIGLVSGQHRSIALKALYQNTVHNSFCFFSRNNLNLGKPQIPMGTTLYFQRGH